MAEELGIDLTLDPRVAKYLEGIKGAQAAPPVPVTPGDPTIAAALSQAPANITGTSGVSVT